MKIVIAGGNIEVDYLIKMFLKSNHDLVIINENRDYCEYLSETNNIAVIVGDSSKTYVLDDAQIINADVLIALSARDADNLVVCQLAKRVFHVKRAIASVSNPKNVSIFMKLGINNAISSSHLIAQTIERLSIIENLVRSLLIEDEKIVITELVINDDSYVAGKAVKDIDSSFRFNISCIFRDPEVIIPKGDTVIQTGDKLIVVSSAIDQSRIVEILQRKRDNE